MKRYLGSFLAKLGVGSEASDSSEVPASETQGGSLNRFRARAYSSGGPLMEGLTLKDAVKQAHHWSYDLTAETAVAYRKGLNPRQDAPDWVVVLVDDYDDLAWQTDPRVRFNNGHSHPDCPWQLHHSATDNPYLA